ncbi:hypothetical protein ABTM58_19525, partial [Acinetobacter baumannii]
LAAQIDAHALPAPDADTLFLVYLPATVSLAGNDATCSALCGTHRAFLHAGRAVYYAVLPDCTRVCGGTSSVALDNFTQLTSWEVIRSVTNPQ